MEGGGTKVRVGVFTQRALESDVKLQVLVRDTHVADERVVGGVCKATVRQGR